MNFDYDIIEKNVKLTQHRLASFLRFQMNEKKMSITEIAYIGNLGTSSLYKNIMKEGTGNFFNLCVTMDSLSTNFEQFFKFEGMSCTKPLICYSKHGFSSVNHKLLLKSGLTHYQFASLIRRDATCFAHFCNVNYPSWMNFSQICIICIIFGISLPDYLGMVSEATVELILDRIAQGITFPEDAFIINDEVALYEKLDEELFPHPAS